MSILPLIRYAGLTSLLVAIVGGLYALGYTHGGKNARVEQLRASVRAAQARLITDQILNKATDVEICMLLGGLKEDCDDSEDAAGDYNSSD